MNKEDLKYIFLIFIIGCLSIALGVGIANAIIHFILEENSKASSYTCGSLGVYASGDYQARVYCSNGKDDYYVYTKKDGEVIVSEDKLD